MSTDTKIVGGIAILTITILVGSVWLLSAQSSKEQAKQNKSLIGEEIPIQTTQHIKPGESHPPYNSNPPTSGWMYDDVAGAGIHEVQVPDEKLIHSMEHGAVVVWYKSGEATDSSKIAGLSSEETEKLKQIFNKASGKKILAPRKNLDVSIALTSWGRLLKLQAIDSEKIIAFIETNENRGPEKAPMY